MGDMVRTITSILKNGGHTFSYKRVTSVGADLGTPDTWHEGVYRLDSNPGFEQPINIITSESGAPLTTEEEDFKMEIMIKSAQLDKALIDFIKDETLSNWYALAFDAGLGQDRKKLHLFAPLAKFERTLKWQGKERKPELKVHILTNPVAVTPASIPTWMVGSAANYAVAANGIFTPYEA
jgi:hypothetical protein